MNDNGLSAASGPLRFQILPSGIISCNAVVLWHEQTRDAVLIDPTDDARGVIAFAREHELLVHHVLLTHGHFDHAADAERAMTEFSCPASIHEDDLPLYRDIPNHAPLFGLHVSPRTLPVGRIVDEQVIEFLPDYPIQVRHTPGHSAGSVAFCVAAAAWTFSGDTLFSESVGRTDLPGGSSKKLTASIQNRLYTLPDETLVIPGHGLTTTIGHEKRHNQFVRLACL
jgi:hydroxyacylglutathione hydrolase